MLNNDLSIRNAARKVNLKYETAKKVYRKYRPLAACADKASNVATEMTLGRKKKMSQILRPNHIGHKVSAGMHLCENINPTATGLSKVDPKHQKRYGPYA